MPPPKPSSLNIRHDTQAEKDARVAAEAALTPRRELPMAEPRELRGYAVDAAQWRELMRTYASADGTIVTRFDAGLLINYCLLVEQLAELDEMRHLAMADYSANRQALTSLREQIEAGGEAISPELLSRLCRR